MFIKICGITRTEDALRAAECGADAVGFMLAESPRRLTINQMHKISQMIPSRIKKVGVFVNPSKQEVEAVLNLVKLDMLQFHGQEDGEFCTSFNRGYIKAIPVAGAFDIKQFERSHPNAHAFLLDAFSENQAGGTGTAFNWSHWPTHSGKKLILAGGLTPNNVFEAVTKTHPYGVDVSGGVEAGVKGVKNADLIRSFVQEARRSTI